MFAGIVSAALVTWWPQREAELTLTVFAVGQGDCVLVKKGNFELIYDTGPIGRPQTAMSSRVLKKLDELGVDWPEMVVISHPDDDHTGGLVALRKRFPKIKVVASEEFRRSPEMLGTLAKAKVPEAEVVWVGTSKFIIGKSKFTFVRPRKFDNDNANSLLLKIEEGGRRALLVGDSSFETEYSSLENLALPIELLFAGHHGSKSSTGQFWLRQLKPKAVVISSGLGNPFGHPHPEVLIRVQAAGAEIYRTDAGSDLKFKWTPLGIRGPNSTP